MLIDYIESHKGVQNLCIIVVEGMKTTSAYDDRTSSKSIGFVGVSVIVVVWLFVIFLDLGVRRKIPRKTKKKKGNKQIRPW